MSNLCKRAVTVHRVPGRRLSKIVAAAGRWNLLAVHLDDRDVVAEERVRAVRELDARVRARELLAAGRPLDRGALVEEVAGVEVGLALFLDHLDLEHLALLLVGDEVRGEHLEDDVRELALRRDERVEVGLARLDGLLDRLERVAALDHVALDLPGELDVVRDVEVEREVEELAHALVGHGVEALDDDDGRRRDLLGRVEGA